MTANETCSFERRVQVGGLLSEMALPVDETQAAWAMLTSNRLCLFMKRVLDTVCEELSENIESACSCLEVSGRLPTFPKDERMESWLWFSLFSETIFVVSPTCVAEELARAYFLTACKHKIRERWGSVELGLGALSLLMLAAANTPARFNLRLVDIIARRPSVDLESYEFYSFNCRMRMFGEIVVLKLLFGREVLERLWCYSFFTDSSCFGRDNSWWSKPIIELNAVVEAAAESLYPVISLKPGARFSFGSSFRTRYVVLCDPKTSKKQVVLKLENGCSSGVLRLSVVSCSFDLSHYQPGYSSREREGGGLMSSSQTLREVAFEAGIELGRVRLSLRELAELNVGSLVSLEFEPGERMQLRINQEPVAEGFLVAREEKLYLQIASVKE
jgi:flagellar motor switch/type III secretory pathway protein FliN